MGQSISSGLRSVGAGIGAPSLIKEAKANAVEAFGGHHLYVLNDGVMGGRSDSSIEVLPSGNVRFSGTINKTGGGFVSCYTDPDNKELTIPEGATKIIIEFSGDGNQYKVNLSDGTGGGPFARSPTFSHDLSSSAGEEAKTIELPLSSFKPGFGGRLASDQSPLVPEKMRQIGFMLSLYDSECKPNPHWEEKTEKFPFAVEVSSFYFS